MKMFQLLLCCLGVAAVAACSTVSSTVTPANVATACGWVQTADVVFNSVAPLSGGKITPAMIADEAKADAAAAVICAPPYPTDVQTALADLLKIVAQIQADSAA